MLAKKLIIVISALAVSGCDASHQSEWGGSDDSTISPPFKKLISPSYIKIFKYYIDLDVFFDDSEAPMYYTGEVEILFGFRSKIKTIDIHGTSFTELHSKLFSPDTNEEHTLNYTVSDADDKIILELPSKIDLKYNVPYHLKFTYRQSIGKKFMGLFYTTYNGVNEIPVGYVATQMQPAFARRVFPCFDEPSLKATFAISITHNSKYTAISNELEYSRAPVNSTPQSMPLTSENRTKTTFQITQKMSTYNVAFVISDFQNLNATDSNEVLHRVFYNNASKYDMHEQLKNSIRTVKYLNDYFDVDYPLAKLDQFPLDIQNVGPSVTGAVENWGLIFYNRHHMIQKNQISTEEYIYETHEIIHQWIGNLITLDDWSEYWINEGLTTYISYMVGNILYPKWNISRHFIDEINTNVFGDWGNAVVPTPAQPESGSDGFDVDVMAISDFSRPEIYTKAAAILKMFDEALGFGIVKEAIQELLREYSHSTINTKTFGQKMHWLIKKTNQTIFHHENMPLILKEWLTNHGTPKIFVNRNYYNDTISFTIKTHDKRASSLQQQPWTIPINFAIGSDPNFNNTGASFVLHSYGDNILQHSQIGLNNISTDEWLILNKQQSGLYSVVYDDYNTKLIVKALISNHTQIHPINRALLFRDFRLNINDITDIASIVDAFTYITNEDDLYAVAEASGAMLDILIKFRGSLLYDKLKGFLLKYSWRFFDKFYTRQPTHLQKDIIIEYLTEIDSPRLLRYVQQRLPNAEVLTNKSMYPLNDVSDMLTCVFFAHMDPNTFSRILWWLQNVEDEQSFVDISYHIPCVRREDLINKFLDVFFDETIKFGVEQTVNSKLRYIAHMFKRSYNARPLILDVLLQKYKLLFTERPLAESILTKIMPYVSSRDKMKVRFFFK